MRLSKLITLLFMVLLVNIGNIRNVNAGPPGDDEIEDPDIPLPMDGGLSLLLLAGGYYGLKRYTTIHNRKK